MKIMSINAGSSSLKFSLFEMDTKEVLVSGLFERIGIEGSFYTIKYQDYKLKEGPWTTTGKLVLSTLTLGIVGAGAGVGFAFIPNPAEIGTGLAIGIPIGCGVGLVVGLITPGCHYKAKKGEAVYAILMDEVSICK